METQAEKTGLSKSAQDILERVKGGPQTAKALSLATGYSVNTVRVSLERLVDDGLIEQADKPRTTGERGRPAFLFQVPTKRAAA